MRVIDSPLRHHQERVEISSETRRDQRHSTAETFRQLADLMNQWKEFHTI